MNRSGEAAVALGVAVLLGGTIGWLLASGNDSGKPTVHTATSGSVASSAVSSAASSTASSSSVVVSSAATSSIGSPAAPTQSAPLVSDVVSAGAVTVTADPPTAKPYQAIEISGTVEGATPGTTLEFARKDGDTLATTQVGRAGSYRLTVKLGRSGTFVVRAVDGTSVLATSEPFTLTVH